MVVEMILDARPKNTIYSTNVEAYFKLGIYEDQKTGAIKVEHFSRDGMKPVSAAQLRMIARRME